MATKPNRVQAKQVLPHFNGVPGRRIQSFDWSSNFTTDSVFELGNSGIVEDSVTLVESNITMNTNEWGTTDMEAMIFGIYETRYVSGSGYATKSLSTIKVNSTGSGGDWSNLEVGKWALVHRFNMHATTNAAEYCKVKARTYSGGSILLTFSPTYNLSALPTNYDTVSMVNNYTITEDTVDANPAHICVPHRYSTTSTNVMYTVALPRAYVDNLSYRVDTGGASEQNYTLLGEEERLLLNSRRELYSIQGSFMSYSDTGTVNFRVPQYSLACVASPYAVYADSNLIYDKYGRGAGTIIHTSGQVTINANFDSGLGVSSTSEIIYYYTLSPSDGEILGYKGLTNITNSIGKLTKGYVDVYFGTSTETEYKLQRCSGIDISIPLTRESVDELGESRSIAKPLEGNLRNEITLTFNRNDLKEYAYMLSQGTSDPGYDNNNLVEILMESLKSVKDVKIIVYYYSSQTTHSADTLLKTITFENCNFIGDSSTTPISGASGLELQFSSQTVSIVGSGNPPTYA